MATIPSARVRRGVFLGLVMILSIAPSGAYAQGAIIPRVVFPPPSNADISPPTINKAVLYWSCYVINTSIPLNCSFNFRIVGVRSGGCPDPDNAIEENACNSGGHIDSAHIGARPKGSVEFPQGDVDPNRTFVEGQTLSATSDRAKILYRVPQVGGVYDVESRMTTPSGFVCINTARWPCNTPTSWFLKGRTVVGVPGLRQLSGPGPDDRYLKARGGAEEHPDAVAYAGTLFTRVEIPRLAKDYFDLTLFQFRLSVNDISLPLGGVFDINVPRVGALPDWMLPHITHREGADVDINRPVIGPGPEDRLPCVDNFALRLAVDQRIKPVARFKGLPSGLYCEPDGQYHIDMEPR